MSRDALVVGINTYQYSGLANLKAPSEDAEAIAQRLEQEGEFNVWRLPEAIHRETHRPLVGKTLKVELTQLKKALVKLFLPEGNSIPDTALFYFSGHGLRKTLGIPEGFLATSDVNPDIEFNGLSLKWLRELLRESPIKQQIVWLDCCHSGELLNFKQEADPGEQGKGRDRCFIAASREFEGSFEEIGSAYSVLTRVLLQGLDPSRCPQRWVTNYSLVDYLNQHLQGATQHPTFTNFGEPINLTRTWEAPEQKVTSEPTQAFCPYKGLEYFDCNDEDPKYFYGRKELTDQLIDKVRQGNFLAIIGASGSGKSSVLRAGLLHQLKLGRQLAGSNQWQIQVMVPGSQPFLNLAAVFVEPNLSKLDYAEQLGRAEGLLKAGADGLRRLVQSSQAPRVVLVIDQFEEVFTSVQDNAEREQFIDCLLGALRQLEEKLCLILAMRADFFSKCIEYNYSGLAQLIQENLVAVSPMEREQLQQAIVKPAERVNLKIEPELVEEMLQDVVNSPGSLPLLQYTLKELWKQRTDEGLKLASYAQLGGVGGTLDKRATEIFAQFPSPQQDVARHIFLNLTQLGEGTEDTRRRVEKRDLITAKHPEALIDEVIGKLADKENRLIVTSELTTKGTATGGVVIVDVAHEALIRHWRLLRQWLNDSRDKLRQQRKIEAKAFEWRNERQERPKTAQDYLLQGRRLIEAREFQQEQGEEFPLSEFASEFIEKSLKHRQLNRLKVIGGLVIVPLIGTTIVGGLVYREVRINQSWDTVQKTQGKEYHPARNEALQTLNFFRVPLRNTSLENAHLREINLSGADLSNADLSGADLITAKLSGANFNGANLSNAYLFNADLSNADLSNANLNGAKLCEVKLNGVKLSGAKLSGAKLSGANFNGAKLSGANLDGANLDGADFNGANFNGADFNGANFNGADFNGANFNGANLSAARLRDANFNGANLSDANLDGADLSLANLSLANLRAAHLGRANLSAAHLGGADLSLANLSDANLRAANLRAANLSNVQNLTPKQVKSACSLQEAYFDPDFEEKLKKEPDQQVDCSLWQPPTN